MLPWLAVAHPEEREGDMLLPWMGGPFVSGGVIDGRVRGQRGVATSLELTQAHLSEALMRLVLRRLARTCAGEEGRRGGGAGQCREWPTAWRCRGLALFAFTLLLILIPTTPATAGNISLGLTPQPEVREGALAVHLTIRNSGDEAARSVSPALHVRDKTARGEVRALLTPNESWQVELAIADAGLGTGKWPYRIMVDYADANEYPFHALHVGTVMVGAAPPAKVAVLGVAAPPLATSGWLELRVKNLGPEARTVALTVHLPEGIELSEPPSPVELAPWEERRVGGSLVNHTGLPGSRYAVFVSAEYDDGPVHQAVVVPTTVEIVAELSVFERRRTMLWVVAGLLVVAWGAAIGWRLAGRRGPEPRRPRT